MIISRTYINNLNYILFNYYYRREMNCGAYRTKFQNNWLINIRNRINDIFLHVLIKFEHPVPWKRSRFCNKFI